MSEQVKEAVWAESLWAACLHVSLSSARDEVPAYPGHCAGPTQGSTEQWDTKKPRWGRSATLQAGGRGGGGTEEEEGEGAQDNEERKRGGRRAL